MFCPACRKPYPDDWRACPIHALDLLTSDRIGKFRIDGVVGIGGMGAVYRATNPDTGAEVAVKVMRPELSATESMRLRFDREAKAVGALKTSHVVKVLDAGRADDGSMYLVMELLEGHTLRDEIAPPPAAMDLARVQMVMSGALTGLAAAHRAGIVHRDLKPDNLFIAMLDGRETPKLLDFGIAHVDPQRTGDGDPADAARRAPQLTQTGAMMGTASYMAPEQVVTRPGTIGPWTDIYAMGAILYEMLSGHAAFGGATLTEVLQRVVSAEHPPLAGVRPGLPPRVYDLVGRCLSVEPAARPQTAAAMLEALVEARLVDDGTPVPAAAVRARASGVEPTELGTGLTPQPSAGRAATPAPVPSAARAPTVDARGPGSRAEAPPPGEPAAARRRWPLAVGAVAVLGLGAGAIVVTHGGGAATPKPGPPLATASAPGSGSGHGSAGSAIAAAVGAGPGSAAPAGSAAPTVTAPADSTIPIAGGTYTIGRAGARPPYLAATQVTTAAFRIDPHEVTRAELEVALGAHVRPALAAALDRARDAASTPARFVSWADADATCRARGERLPSEAEWEIAAQTTPQDPSRARLKRAGAAADLRGPSTDCSAAGLCDMLGSLSEWTATDADGGKKVVRGASYTEERGHGLDTIHLRETDAADNTDATIGFRCVKEGP